MRLLRVVNTGRNCELGTRVGLADAGSRDSAGCWASRLRSREKACCLPPAARPICTACAFHSTWLSSTPRGRRGHVSITSARLANQWHWDAVHALELPAGTLEASGTAMGDVLTWADAAC